MYQPAAGTPQRGKPWAPASHWKTTATVIIVAILAVAAGLRGYKLGQLSFWYDEIVTMRLATAPSTAALFDRLFRIEATRAPLHPLLLHLWIGLFGSSEAAARSLSVVCGIITVVLVYWIGRSIFDRATGLWAALLTAISPPLVYYSREARMYSMLVMISCLCWGLVFSFRQRGFKGQVIAYALLVVALVFCHPLGLLMAATLALGTFLFAREFFGGWRRWLVAQLVAALLFTPWVRYYFDHDPEFLSGRLPLRFLIGTPIGFIGGNAVVLLGLLSLIGYGLLHRRGSLEVRSDWSGPACLVLWLVLPTVSLYAYSWIAEPVFGPSRYTLYTAPAYLILVAQGLVRLPWLGRACVAVAIITLAMPGLAAVNSRGAKADWRSFATELAERMARSPETEVTVFVECSDTERNKEIQTARYYLPDSCRIYPLIDVASLLSEDDALRDVYLTVGSKPGVAGLPSVDLFRVGKWDVTSYAGLTVYHRLELGQDSRKSAASRR
jgi:4-amino-4-deoxy-L-arabinose transferase-like glycosyltransferase